MGNKRITLRDIAVVAGVHVTTVSLALRNHPSLPVATRTRLQTLAAKMGYTPDPMLSALTAYRRHAKPLSSAPTIAYLSFGRRESLEVEGGHALAFFLSSQRRCQELGYRFDHVWMRQAGIATARWNKILLTRNPAGLILAPLPQGRGHLRLDWSRFSAVRIEESLVHPHLHTVGNNQYQCIQLAVRHAHRLGYRRVGLVIKQGYDEVVNRFWSAGFWGQQQHFPRKDWVHPHLPRTLQKADFGRWMKREQPEVILSHHYKRIPAWLQEMGYSVPGDVGFIDLDLQDLASLRAGVQQSHHVVGTAAVDQLVGLIQRNERGIPAHTQLTLIEGQWVDGNTVARGELM